MEIPNRTITVAGIETHTYDDIINIRMRVTTKSEFLKNRQNFSQQGVYMGVEKNKSYTGRTENFIKRLSPDANHKEFNRLSDNAELFFFDGPDVSWGSWCHVERFFYDALGMRNKKRPNVPTITECEKDTHERVMKFIQRIISVNPLKYFTKENNIDTGPEPTHETDAFNTEISSVSKFQCRCDEKILPLTQRDGIIKGVYVDGKFTEMRLNSFIKYVTTSDGGYLVTSIKEHKRHDKKRRANATYWEIHDMLIKNNVLIVHTKENKLGAVEEFWTNTVPIYFKSKEKMENTFKGG